MRSRKLQVSERSKGSTRWTRVCERSGNDRMIIIAGSDRITPSTLKKRMERQLRWKVEIAWILLMIDMTLQLWIFCTSYNLSFIILTFYLFDHRSIESECRVYCHLFAQKNTWFLKQLFLVEACIGRCHLIGRLLWHFQNLPTRPNLQLQHELCQSSQIDPWSDSSWSPSAHRQLVTKSSSLSLLLFWSLSICHVVHSQKNQSFSTPPHLSFLTLFQSRGCNPIGTFNNHNSNHSLILHKLLFLFWNLPKCRALATFWNTFTGCDVKQLFSTFLLKILKLFIILLVSLASIVCLHQCSKLVVERSHQLESTCVCNNGHRKFSPELLNFHGANAGYLTYRGS